MIDFLIFLSSEARASDILIAPLDILIYSLDIPIFPLGILIRACARGPSDTAETAPKDRQAGGCGHTHTATPGSRPPGVEAATYGWGRAGAEAQPTTAAFLPTGS